LRKCLMTGLIAGHEASSALTRRAMRLASQASAKSLVTLWFRSKIGSLLL
jgi:hypothetical protein